jgi:hypothetical protein
MSRVFETFVELSLSLSGGIPKDKLEAINHLQQEIDTLLKSATFELNLNLIDDSLIPYNEALKYEKKQNIDLLKMYKQAIYQQIASKITAYRNKRSNKHFEETSQHSIAKEEEEEDSEEDSSQETEPEPKKKSKEDNDGAKSIEKKKKPGRPPGSKNKPKQVSDT